MTETSLYRRHRPQSFDEVVGQEHVVRTLRNAVQRDRVHHAYLFVGSRGTGKTSVAKILARSLNCERGPTVEPCGQCESCRTIAAGTSLDVIEMDAASNRSVDDIRELRERVGYVPAAGRWKIYILDEAHMLTREAWNAFLKTLEEPPPNTVFVLATTEPHKVMPTIVDRCQRFDFQRPSAEQISAVLERVAAAEGIEFEEGAKAMVARAAAGSFRDALATLDQLVAYGGPKVRTEDVLDLLGAADADLLFATADAVADGDGRGVLRATEALANSGRDPVQFARDLVDHLRQLLVVQVAGELPPAYGLTAPHADRLRQQAGRFPDQALARAIDSVSEALAGIREGDEPRMSLEVALLRAAHPQLDPSREALAERIELLERRLAGASPASQKETPGDSGSEPEARATTRPRSSPRAPAEGGGPAARASAEAAPAGTEAPEEHEATDQPPRAPLAGLDLERINGLWPAIVEQVRQSGSDLLSTVYEAARPLALDAEKAVLEVGFPASAAFNKRKAEAQANRERFAEAVRTIIGERLRPVYVLLDGEEEEENGGPEPSEEELVEQVKSAFDAEELHAGPDAGKPAGGAAEASA